MKDSLARKLLTKVIDWPSDKLTNERYDLQMLADYKYDEYQQFAPGIRFMESLTLWLERFPNYEEKEIAYKYVKQKLVFISTRELEHLIQMTYVDTIRPHLINIVSEKYQIEKFAIKKIVNDVNFKITQRKCLFLGLSDGAKLDLFRRLSASLKHEQIYPTYLITEEKADELKKELNDDIKKLTRKPANERYEMIFLIDDFSASGISYIRTKKDGNRTGKIVKFLRQIINDDDKFDFIAGTIDTKKLKLCVVLYVATTRAIQRIRELVREHVAHTSIQVDVCAIQEIDDSVGLHPDELDEMKDVLKHNFQYDDIVTPQYKNGKHDEPYLGFDECGLLLIMSHNCPNNSVPILWYENEEKDIPALFPRVQRYRGD